MNGKYLKCGEAEAFQARSDTDCFGGGGQPLVEWKHIKRVAIPIRCGGGATVGGAEACQARRYRPLWVRGGQPLVERKRQACTVCGRA